MTTYIELAYLSHKCIFLSLLHWHIVLCVGMLYHTLFITLLRWCVVSSGSYCITYSALSCHPLTLMHCLMRGLLYHILCIVLSPSNLDALSYAWLIVSHIVHCLVTLMHLSRRQVSWAVQYYTRCLVQFTGKCPIWSSPRLLAAMLESSSVNLSTLWQLQIHQFLLFA